MKITDKKDTVILWFTVNGIPLKYAKRFADSMTKLELELQFLQIVSQPYWIYRLGTD